MSLFYLILLIKNNYKYCKLKRKGGFITLKKWKVIKKQGYNIILNEGRQNIAYSPDSGIKIIEEDGYAFKNLSKSGQLEKYEDWRLPIEERAKDLASKMSIEL